ncbi:MAG: hypothetical protein JXP34_19735, partial [Planctomycetes bacterium]|nr:hypothetical protein [Planctomycetota bacterium]
MERTIARLGLIGLFAAAMGAPAKEEPAWREKPEPRDEFMGDWQGTFTQRNGKTSPLVAQVIALGRGEYHANLLAAFDERAKPIATLEGHLEKDGIRFLGWGDVSAY